MSDRDRSAPAKDAPRKNKIGARKHGSFMAISTAPSINYTPIGPAMVPIPYPTVQDLTNSVGTASTVRLNGCPAYVLDSSKQSACKGDAPGTGKGVKSGTISGEVKPVFGSSSVRIEGKNVVRAGDPCTMNGGNNPGVYVATPPAIEARTSDGTKLNSSSNFIFETEIESSAHRKCQPGRFLEQTPTERLAGLLLSDTLDGSSALRRTARQARNTILGEKLGPSDTAVKALRLRSTNNIEIAILGIFGAAGLAARFLGQGEDQVAAANQVGLAAMGVATTRSGIPHARAANVAFRSFPRNLSSANKAAPDGMKVRGTGSEAALAAQSKTTTALKVEAEILALSKFGGTNPGPGERAITRQQYRRLISKYRNKGDRLQAELETAISQQQFVYRATTMRVVDIYRTNGTVSGKSGPVYMSTEYVGLDPKILMDRGQVFPHWGTPEVVLKIPTSAITKATVPRPFGNKSDVGWEPNTEAYPAAGKGGMNQFLGETKTWDDSWIMVVKPGN